MIDEKLPPQYFEHKNGDTYVIEKYDIRVVDQNQQTVFFLRFFNYWLGYGAGGGDPSDVLEEVLFSTASGVNVGLRKLKIKPLPELEPFPFPYSIKKVWNENFDWRALAYVLSDPFGNTADKQYFTFGGSRYDKDDYYANKEDLDRDFDILKSVISSLEHSYTPYGNPMAEW